MWSAATIADTLKHDAHHYGFSGGSDAVKSLDWPKLKAARDAYVKRLNGIYGNGFAKAGVEDIRGKATFVDANTLEVKGDDGNIKTLTADRILVATGGRPHIPADEGVAENVISSDGFFDLEELPKVAVVVGAGYIAVELAGVLNSLGSEVHLVVRKQKALREFDPMISDALDAEMIKAGIHIHRNTGGVASIEVKNDKKTVTTVVGDALYGADVVLMAPGRIPNVENLNLEKAGVELTPKNHIKVDEYSNTSTDNIYASVLSRTVQEWQSVVRPCPNRGLYASPYWNHWSYRTQSRCQVWRRKRQSLFFQVCGLPLWHIPSRS